MAKLKKRKDGRYQRKVTLSDGRQKIVYGRTLAELNAAEDSLREQDRAGLQVGDHTLVGEWAKVWIDNNRKGARVKKPGQWYLQTWHGFALKRIERFLNSL